MPWLCLTHQGPESFAQKKGTKQWCRVSSRVESSGAPNSSRSSCNVPGMSAKLHHWQSWNLPCLPPVARWHSGKDSKKGDSSLLWAVEMDGLMMYCKYLLLKTCPLESAVVQTSRLCERMHEVWVRHRIYGEKAAGRVSSPEERLDREDDKIFQHMPDALPKAQRRISKTTHPVESWKVKHGEPV